MLRDGRSDGYHPPECPRFENGEAWRTGAEIGATQDAISLIENRRADPTVRIIEQLANVIGIAAGPVRTQARPQREWLGRDRVISPA
jgi:transcriptional regulator with XRE-family HTH domain